MRKLYTLAAVVLCLGLLLTPKRVEQNPTTQPLSNLSAQNTFQPPAAQAAAMDPIPDGDIRNCSAPCGAGDVTVSHVFIGTSPTNPITTCTPGTLVNGNVYVEIASGNSGDRSAIRFAADVYIGGVFYATYLDCYSGPLMDGQTHLLNVGAISWTCGPEVELRDIKVAWTTHGDPCSADQTCMDYPGGQCWQQMSFNIEAPLSADFTYECGSVSNSIDFTSMVTGGDMSYTYAWDFGDGTTSTDPNPMHTFPSVNTYTVKLVVTDNGAQMAMSSHDVDLSMCCQPPTITCPNPVTVNCGNTTLPVATGTATYENGCGTTSITYSDVTTGSAPCARTITRTWKATDQTPSSDVCVQTLTINPAPPATFTSTPANITVDCGATIAGTPLPYSNGASGVCEISGSITGSIQGSSSACTGGSYTETWTLTDPCGRPNIVASRTITVSPAAVPSFTSLPGDITLDCSQAPPSSSLISYTNNQAGVCLVSGDIASVISVGTSGTCGTYIENWSVTTDCGTPLSHSRIIHIIDVLPPFIICPANVSVNCGDSWMLGQATAVDNCDANPIIASTQIGTIGDCGTGSYTVRWYATDHCGNIDSCDQTVAFYDATPPTITCPADLTFDCIEGAPGDPATATDNCTATNAIQIASNDVRTLDACGLGLIVRTWTATDCAGLVATCNQSITIQDTTPPTITCPNDATFNCQPSFAGTAVATDNCSPVLVTGIEDFSGLDPCGLGAIVVTWTATDCHMNASTCVQTITIRDVTAPSITCPSNVTFNCAEGAAGMATASDNCSAGTAITIGSSDESMLDICGLGTIARTWTATDCAGLSSSCVQTITIQDTTKPTITCQANVTFVCTDDIATTVAAMDNCTLPLNISLVFNDDEDLDACGLGTILRTWTATDCAGNIGTCNQTLTIQDNTPPTIICPPPITFDCMEGSTPEPIVSDNCTDPNAILLTFSDNDALNECGVGSITRTWTATDCAGLSSTCMQSIFVRDLIPPSITCPSDVTFDCTLGNAGYPSANDNCDPSPEIDFFDLDDRDACGLGSIIRQWTANDCSLNTANCIQYIYVQDNAPPTITCPGDVTVDCNVADAGSPTAIDNCTANNDLNIYLADSEEDLDNCGLGIIYQYWEVTDCAGLSDQCTQMITIQDTTKPEITCPSNVRFECEIGNAGTPSVSDNCTSSLTPTMLDVPALNNCGVGTITRTWTVMDCAGNESSCVQTIEIYDDTPPTITCPANISASCDEDISLGLPEVIDNCDPEPSISQYRILVGKDCPNAATIIIRWYASDACGNIDSCDQTVVIYDHEAPVFDGPLPADITVACGQIPPAPRLTATDNCGEVSIDFSETEEPMNGCPIIGQITRTWVASDECGNTTTHVQILSIADDTAPVVAGAPANLCDVPMTYSEVIDMKFPALTFFDECTSQTIIAPDPVITYNCDLNKFEVAYVAADQCGNVANFVQDVCIEYSRPECTIVPNEPLYCGGVGSLRAEITGGIGPYTYMWVIYDNPGWEIVGPNNEEVVHLRSNLSSVRIGLMVTDMTGCGTFCDYYTGCTNWEACAVDSRMYSMYNGMFCDMAPMYNKLKEIFEPGPITIGVPGTRSFTVDWDHFNCLYALLAMQGEPQALLPGEGTFDEDCIASNIQLQHVKSSANALANEAMTLSLNMRLDTLIKHVAFFDYCVITAQAADCSQMHPFEIVPNTLDTTCLPESLGDVFDHWPITAGEILDLGNRALAGESVGVSYQDLTRALHTINETFNNCRVILRYGIYDIPKTADIVTMTRRHGPCAMVAFPNPTTETSVLQISLDQKREVHLELFDAYGKSYYQTDFEGIKGIQNKTLDLKSLKPGMYFVQMTSGDLSINTKLLKVN